MIYICDAYGNAVRCIPQRVVQGSAEGCVLTVAAPVAENAQFSVCYRLPSGAGTVKRYLTCIGLLEGLQGEGGLPLYGWRDSVPAAVTAHYGTVTAQFSFVTADGSVQAGAPVLFTVERGIAGDLPPLPGEGIYQQILAAIAQLGADMISARFAARALYAYNEKFVYAAGEIVYCPDAYDHGTFVRSLVSDNAAAPYTEEGILNAEAWEEVCRFDDVFEQASLARQQAQIASSAALEAAGSSAEAAQSAADAEANAVLVKNLASEVSENAGSAKESARQADLSAQLSAEYADLSRKYSETALQTTFEYKTYESLPRPGTRQFLYMVPSADGKAKNMYDEYVWSDEMEDYEKLGSSMTADDLNAYATKEYANALVYTSSPIASAGEPAVGSTLKAALSSFSRTPAAGDHFTALCREEQSGETYYVGAKVEGISASETTALVLSCFSLALVGTEKITLTQEQYSQYLNCDGADTVITLDVPVEGGKSFALLDLAGNGALLLTACGAGYTLAMPYGEGGMVCLLAQESSLSVRFLRGLPLPSAGDAGKVPTVNAAGDGYELKLSQGGSSPVLELGELKMQTTSTFSGTVSDENYEKLAFPNTVIKVILPYGMGDLYGIVSPFSGGYYSVAAATLSSALYIFTIAVSSDKSILCSMVDITPIDLKYVSSAGSDDRWQEVEANIQTNKIYARRELPMPTAEDAGKMSVVNATGDGYELRPFRRLITFTPAQSSMVQGTFTGVKPYMRPLSEQDAYCTSEDSSYDPEGGFETTSDYVPFYIWGAGYKIDAEDTVNLGGTTYDQAILVKFPPDVQIRLLRKIET